jgi:TetR/AcrR family transcriptional repressor of nem operon
LVLNESICLCAVMGAEAIGLPESVNQRTKAFFEINRLWLETLLQAHGAKTPAAHASMVVAALEGAMIVASASNDRSVFDQVAKAAVLCIIEH